MTALRTHARGVLLTTAVLAIWAVLAIRSPDLTYHFAPLIAGAAWPIVIRREGPPPVRDAVWGALGAFVSTSVVALLLATGGYLDGPTFWNEGPALTEALLFTALGAALGAAVSLRPATVSAA